MKYLKTLSFIICSFILVFTGAFFVGCGSIDYSNMQIQTTVNGEQRSSLTLNKDASAAIMFTITNFNSDMQGEIVVNSPDNANYFDYQTSYNGNGVTTVAVTGKTGGKAHLYARSKEGNLTASFEITVREYSNLLQNTSKNLYVTQSASLSPTSSDFTFTDTATERRLDYYFYGTASTEDVQLSLDALRNSDGQLYQSFVNVRLISQNDHNYLIFTDATGNEYTIQSTPSDLHRNVRMAFIAATLTTSGQYTFSGEAKQVLLGDRFTFVANYSSDKPEEIFVQRDFYVLRDLQGDNIEYSYTFSGGTATYSNRDIVLIPNREQDGISYKSLTLTVTLPTDSDMIDLDYTVPEVDGIKLATVVKGVPTRGQGRTVYTYTISNSSTTSQSGEFELNYFYKGYQDEKDPSVSFHLPIDLHVAYQPEHLTVNQDAAGLRSYKFYDQYADSFAGGWQTFDVDCLPDISVYDSLEVVFDNQQLMMRYQGQIIRSGNFSLTNLNAPIEFRGISGAQHNPNYITLRLHYNILEDNTIEYNIPYTIESGASDIFSVEDGYYITNGVYVNLGQTVEFTGFYADADFQSVTANFVRQDSNPYNIDCVDITGSGSRREGDQYSLVLSVTAKRVGRGQYNLTLDNGTTRSVYFEVIESLDSLSAIVDGQDIFTQNIEAVDGDEPTPAGTYIYIRNKNDVNGPVVNEKAIVNLYANGRTVSQAIRNSTLARESGSSGFSFTNPPTLENGHLSVELSTTGLGSGVLTFTVYGQSVTEDFKINSSKTLNYKLFIVSYSDIGQISILKLQDGIATYPQSPIATEAIVYYNTKNTSKTTAQFDVRSKFSGLLFFDPLKDQTLINDPTSFDADPFQKSYVYWTANAQVTQDGRPVEGGRMVYDSTPGANNRYIIEGRGQFDTETFTFEAFDTLFSLQLTANVRQFGQVFSTPVSIRSVQYNDVTMLSLQESDKNSNLTFRASRNHKQVVVYAQPKDATDPSLDKVVKIDNIMQDGQLVTPDLFGRDGIQITNEGGGVFTVDITIDPTFIHSRMATLDQPFQGQIVIASADWIVGEDVPETYLPYCVTINVFYANGTQRSPYLLETPEDVLSIQDTPESHFIINSTLDLSTLSSARLRAALPIGKDSGGFSGSLRATSDKAAITGIEVVYGTETNYYGLFSRLQPSAVIEGVRFSGKINAALNLAAGSVAFVGLVCGDNEGQLINVGVTLTDNSGVTISGQAGDSNVYIGLVAGRNQGLILQDYGKYVAGEFAGATPNILVYGADYTLTVGSNTEQLFNLYVGGVTGNNYATESQSTYAYDSQHSLTYGGGSIIKIDDKQILSFGYTNYLAYLNISISGNGKNYAGVVAGVSTGPIYAIAGVNFDLSQPEIAYKQIGLEDENAYVAGKGITVGGSIVDNTLVDNESAFTDTYQQIVGGVVGRISNVTFDKFTGITSRVSVLATRESIGTITGKYEATNPGQAITPAYALQAVDSGKVGIYSSMLAKIYNHIDDNFIQRYPNYFKYEDANEEEQNAKFTLNLIAFGTGYPFAFLTDTSAQSYVRRELADVYNASQETTYYYGDFVVAKSVNGPLVTLPEQPTYVHYEFNKIRDIEGLDISGSQNFNNTFDAPVGAPRMYYAFYFRSAGFVYQDANDDNLTESQKHLDDVYNVVRPGDYFYPLTVGDGVVLSSTTADVLSIDQSGKITLKNTGIATIKVTSILDTNNSLQFYLNVVSYFNTDSENEILYPTLSDASYPINNRIDIKGDSAFNAYIIPKVDTDSEHLRIEGGVLIDQSNVRIAGNDTVSINLTIYKKEGGGQKQQICQIGPDEESTDSELQVRIIGQVLTISKTDTTGEYLPDDKGTTYYLEATPVIPAQVTVNKGEQYTYKCEVNKKIEDLPIYYNKGAISISTLNYATVPLLISSKEIKETIKITSAWGPNDKDIEGGVEVFKEQNPYYVIERGPNALYSTNPSIAVARDNNGNSLEDRVFVVEFGTMQYVADKDNKNIHNYEVPLRIYFNTQSNAYKNRYATDIYGQYSIVFYAKSDPSKYVVLTIELERTQVGNVNIDNYSDEGTLSDFSSANHVGVPGKRGILAVTITPQDCDFDYITIENDQLNSLDGNGRANFSLVARDALQASEGKIAFRTTSISGQVTDQRIRLRMADIVSEYAKPENVDYSGIVYIRYNIGTAGVSETGRSKFNVILTSDGEDSPKYPIDLQLKLEFHAYAGLVDKQPVSYGGDQDVYATYQVARGLRYEITLEDIWGYTAEDVTLSIEGDSRYAWIVEEDGKQYVQITPEVISYGDYGVQVSLVAQATQTVGEITRTNRSVTPLQILEYVVNYNYDYLGNADIISHMENGSIGIRVGNKEDLAVDIIDFIEFDQSDVNALNNVNRFMEELTQNGEWTLYTNIEDGEATGGVITNIQDAPDVEQLSPERDFSNIYLYVDGLSVRTRKIHNSALPYYLFTYSGGYNIRGGLYRYADYDFNSQDNIAAPIYTQFALNVYQTSSLDSPIPIENYQQLTTSMQPGGNYILTEDIVIPNSDTEGVEPFVPINVDFASFDGNGKTISFAGTYNFGEATAMALFSQVYADSLVKNVTVQASDRVVFKTSSSQPFDAALLAVTNLGTITNCNAVGGEEYFTVEAPNLTNQSYLTSLVVRNAGALTHSRSSLSISTSGSHASGLVGINTGDIASSYFKGGRIAVSSPQHYLGGLVVTNQEGGTIRTSYVSGNVTAEYVFSRDTANVLYSTSQQAGFAFTNEGEISDCYSNIQIQGSSSSAGFVFNNAGPIQNSFSLSVLSSNNISSAGFAMNDTSADQVGGLFEKCYYFINRRGVESGYPSLEDINISLSHREFEGITAIDRSGFDYDEADNNDTFKTLFSTYATFDLTTQNANSVWFYSRAGASSQLFDNQIFGGGRLELVSANIIASSNRILAKERTTEDADGQTHYEYDIAENAEAEGSIKNPYLIRSAEELESFIIDNSTTSGYNYNNYRIVNNISYSDYGQPSQLYRTTLCGVLEGNGMSISNIILNSAQRMDSAGMFAQIGRNATNIGVVMNLNIQPMQDITFNNTSVVGGLAGRLNYGYVYNVDITKLDGDQAGQAVSGANIIGGVVGLAENNYGVFNAHTNMSVIANFQPAEDVVPYENNTRNIAAYSYAGGLIGFASGRGSVVNSSVDSITTIMGARVGLAFGGVGKNATINKLTVIPSSLTTIRAFKYGGLAIGENAGTLSVIDVQNGAGIGTGFRPFALVPSRPDAVGGVVGLNLGGQLDHIQMSQDFSTVEATSTQFSDAGKISYVGGLIGQTGSVSVRIQQAVVNANILANSTLGGVVGYAGSSVNLSEVAVKSATLTIGGDSTNGSYAQTSRLGGFIGQLQNNGTQIKDSYVLSNLVVNTFVYAETSQCFVGHFVGQTNDSGVYLMERCYASGGIDVTMRDRRSTDKTPVERTGTVADTRESADIIRARAFHVAAGQSGDVMDNTTDVNENARIKDVYYWGSYNTDEELTLSGSRTMYEGEDKAISYKSNAKENATTFTYTKIGTGSAQLGAKITANTSFNPIYDRSALYNLFNYKWLIKYVVENEDASGTTDSVVQKEFAYYKSGTITDLYYELGSENGKHFVLDSGAKFVDTAEDKNYFIATDSRMMKDLSASDVTGKDRQHLGIGSVWKIVPGQYSTLLFEDEIANWFN